jgi:hypothetical protein
MPRMGFEAMISVFEPARTVHDLVREATVIGSYFAYVCNTNRKKNFARDRKWKHLDQCRYMFHRD